jgi:hypothetical protein
VSIMVRMVSSAVLFSVKGGSTDVLEAAINTLLQIGHVTESNPLRRDDAVKHHVRMQEAQKECPHCRVL